MHPCEYKQMLAGKRKVTHPPAGEADRAPVEPRRSPQSPRAPPLDDDTLLTSHQTRARVGNVSTMCLWRWMRDDRVRFPPPIKINTRNYWRLGDLRAWQAAHAAMGHRAAAQDAAA
jgi:predicted DNA-binding transcriptional regulator AlpA